MRRQTKDFTLKLTKGLDETGSFVGLASTYGGSPDLYGDIVAPGAFAQAINRQGDGYPLLWAHDGSTPIGRAKISDSPKGLLTNGLINLETQAGRDAHSNLKFKSVRGLSIGYDCAEGKYTVDQAGVRTLQEVRLWEISLVALPANQNALVTDVKSLDDALRIMRDAAVSPDAITLAQLRSISKELVSILDPDDSEDEDEDEDDGEDLAAQQEAALILKSLTRDLKGMLL
jgi:HK97 family phage prohead protease